MQITANVTQAINWRRWLRFAGIVSLAILLFLALAFSCAFLTVVLMGLGLIGPFGG